jgi:CheY-like chemotaxis protein
VIIFPQVPGLQACRLAEPLACGKLTLVLDKTGDSKKPTMKKRMNVKCSINPILDKIEIRPATEPEFSSSRRCILVVEDDAYIRELYSDVLGSTGYQVDSAKDGESGWEMLRAHSLTSNYDLLITDDKMPKLSGTELIQKLHSEHVNIPVILASGTLSVFAKDLKVAAVLNKPFLPDQLTKVVREVLHAENKEPGQL